MGEFRTLFRTLGLTIVGLGCSGSERSSPPSPALGGAEPKSVTEPVARAAFMEIEPMDYQDALGAQHAAGARLFYSLLPAAQGAKDQPLFVFFNGGPGYDTTGILHAFGTGPTTVDIDAPQPRVVANSQGFDQLGNLLYIDARNTGFSYCLTEDPSDDAQRQAATARDSQNEWLDAADFVRVIVRVLEQEPALRSQPVVLVGESYGASRAAMALSLLFSPQRLETGAADELVPYVDPPLAAELRAHYAAVFPDLPFEELNAEVVTRQFVGQVLIQPAFGLAWADNDGDLHALSDCSPDSPMSRASAERGATCPLQLGQFDINLLEKPDGFMDSAFRAGITSMLEPDGFEARFFVPPAAVVGLPAAQRATAFRFADVAKAEQRPVLESPDWQRALGDLPTWDRYFLDVFPEPGGFDGDLAPLQNAFQLFLRQLPWVKTLITDAFFDLDTPTRDLLKVIADLQQTGHLDLSASYDAAPRAGELRSGWLDLDYGASFNLPDARRHPSVRMPLYEHSGHNVTVTQGAELMQDVRDFFVSSAAAP
jgi:hypothetical protein